VFFVFLVLTLTTFTICPYSGPVTGGVLRGERSRFQLFGDTMNTASRVETTGERAKIQISADTAKLLVEAGKDNWFKPRDDKVYAKGKGEMQTYWLKLGKKGSKTAPLSRRSSHSTASSDDYEFDTDDSEMSDFDAEELLQNLVSEKTSRLIDWNVRVLERLLKTIVVHRQVKSSSKNPVVIVKFSDPKQLTRDAKPYDEIQGTITLPEFDARTAEIRSGDVESCQLDADVLKQLHDLVTNIAIMYRNNPFHNFEHATHVVNTVAKHLSRIVSPLGVATSAAVDRSGTAQALHEKTYGISSDPLTLFACVFSALIHDADHPGMCTRLFGHLVSLFCIISLINSFLSI